MEPAESEGLPHPEAVTVSPGEGSDPLAKEMVWMLLSKKQKKVGLQSKTLEASQ